MNNQEQHGNLPPAVISTKDHLYLEDMLNWNLLAMKKLILWRNNARIRR